jgi:hypothetical protein
MPTRQSTNPHDANVELFADRITGWPLVAVWIGLWLVGFTLAAGVIIVAYQLALALPAVFETFKGEW